MHRTGGTGASKRKSPNSVIMKLDKTHANKINLLHYRNKLPLKSLFIIRLLEESQFFCMQHVPLQQYIQQVITQSCWLEAALCSSTQSSSLCATRVFQLFIHLSLQKKVCPPSIQQSRNGASSGQLLCNTCPN